MYKNETDPNLKIEEVIDLYKVINKQRIDLNNTIKAHYEPLLTDAAKNQDKQEFHRLLSELPDCPFTNTAYRIGELYKIEDL